LTSLAQLVRAVAAGARSIFHNAYTFFIRTRSSFFAQNLRTINNNPSLSRRTKSQIL